MDDRNIGAHYKAEFPPQFPPLTILSFSSGYKVSIPDLLLNSHHISGPQRDNQCLRRSFLDYAVFMGEEAQQQSLIWLFSCELWSLVPLQWACVYSRVSFLLDEKKNEEMVNCFIIQFRRFCQVCKLSLISQESDAFISNIIKGWLRLCSWNKVFAEHDEKTTTDCTPSVRSIRFYLGLGKMSAPMMLCSEQLSSACIAL